MVVGVKCKLFENFEKNVYIKIKNIFKNHNNVLNVNFCTVHIMVILNK
jgi:hypothetical protein